LLRLAVDIVIDAGANRGQFAHELRDIGYKGWIVSFEPIQAEFEKLVRSFEGDAKWKGYRLALGQEEKDAEFHIHAATDFSSFLEPRSKTRISGSETVRMSRLDALFDELSSLSRDPKIFLKMDTQGYDVEVFKGASGILPHIRGLQSELSIHPLYVGMPHYLEALAEYEKAGFELVNLAVVGRRDNGALQEMNCLMQKAAA
jgi:FkbM family methyltransferase